MGNELLKRCTEAAYVVGLIPFIDRGRENEEVESYYTWTEAASDMAGMGMPNKTARSSSTRRWLVSDGPNCFLDLIFFFFLTFQAA